VVEDLGTITAIDQALHIVEPMPSPDADISVTPTSVDFGQVSTGGSSDLTLTVSNVGLTTLNVTGLATTAAEFSVVDPAVPFGVSPSGGSQLVTLRCSPTVVGVVNGDLEITSDDPDEPLVTVPLTCEGVVPGPVEFRITAGGADFTDSGGNLFVADKAFVAGDFGHVGSDLSKTFTSPIAGTTDDLLYQTQRAGSATWGYNFDSLSAGDYDVTLYFAEPSSGTGSRTFDVAVEGIVLLPGFDVQAAAGGSLTAHTETFTVNVSDGQLNIELTPLGTPRAILSAVEVVLVTGPPPTEYAFTDVTTAAGVADELHGHFGVMWFDYNGDGLYDLWHLHRRDRRDQLSRPVGRDAQRRRRL
jgi:hypothetical protein